MTSLLAQRAWPVSAVVLAVVAFGVLGVFVRARLVRGLRGRWILLGGVILGALLALHTGLVWAGVALESYLRLARPWVTMITLASTSFVAIRLAQRVSRAGIWRRRLGDVVTMGAVLSLAMAAAGPEIGHPLDRLTVIVAVDRSRSIELVPGAETRVGRELATAELGMRKEDRVGVVAFAADAVCEDPPHARSVLAAPQRAVIGRDGTDVALAIRRSLAEVPADSAARIVLVTDGVANRGDTMGAAAAALAAQVPVDVLPLEQRPIPDVRVVSFRAPSRADEGEAIDLRIVTASSIAGEVEVRLLRDGAPLAATRARVRAGEDVLRIRERAPGPGLHRYDVEISALEPGMDDTTDDNAASAFVRVRGQAVALVLEGEAGKDAFLAQSLEAGAFKVDQGGTGAVPADLAGLAGYDVVVLSDVRAADLSATQIDAFASYVRDLGGGLILMGGDKSLGPGGYSRTPIEEVSPVSFDLKQERRRASLAEVIGIDISGSMGARAGGHTKLELANEAAARSAALLGTGDRLGVAHVDTEVHWSVVLGPVTDKASIDAAIRGVGVGGGGIYVDITLDAGYAALAREHVNLKHMLLFADGSDAEQMTGCDGKVMDAHRAGITTSVVAMGDGSDVPALEKLSRLGEGRFYLVEDATRLPAVFAQETILAARSSIIEKDFQVDRGAPSAATAAVDVESAPLLKGYVVTIAKPRASVLLRGPEGDPILAVWSAGMGRAATFTTDLKDRWGRAWTTWPDAARLFAQTARDVARKGEDGRLRLETEATGGELHVSATVVGDDGRAQSFRRLAAHVAGPDGFAREVALEATGAGVYAATILLSRPGTYITVARDDISGEAAGTSGAALSAGDELRPTGSDLALLAHIAELTGGKRRSSLDGIFADRAVPRFAYEDATPTLLMLAAIALLLTVAARRLSLPDGVVAVPGRVADWIRRAPAPPAPDVSPKEATLGALLGARDRSRTREPPGPGRISMARDAELLPIPPRPRAPRSSAPRSIATRQLSAAEILLARRKGRGPNA